MMASLRARLLAGTIGGMVLLLICFGLVVYVMIRRALLNEFDRSLASTAEILAALIEVETDEVQVDLEVQQMPEFNDAEHSAFYQIWKPNGEVVAKSPLLGVHNLPRFHGPAGTPAYQVFRDPRNHRPDRAVGIQFAPRVEQEDPGSPPTVLAEPALIMVVARDAGALYRRLSFLRWLLLGTAGGTAGLTLLVGAVVVRRGLRPLQSIATEIAVIDETSLGAQVGDESTPTELTPIRDRLNSLLSQLKGAFDHERRFSANVAHELRNPLAGMRSTIEVTLTRTREDAEYRHALSECLGIVESMEAMVNNLLLLARMDADRMVLHPEKIALATFVDAVWEPFSAQGRERALTFGNRVPRDMTVTCDRQNLRAIFSNLLSNAVEHADPGSRVWMEARITEDLVQIAVANTGCRLDPEQATRVCDRFWRADASRSDTGTHCGLGLSLVRRIVEAQGGSIRVTVENGTFTFRLTLPQLRHRGAASSVATP